MPDGRGWAVVTGASSGIGAAFAVELGRRGHQVLLVGRDQGRLDAVAARVPSSRTLAADLSDPAGLSAVQAFLTDPGTPVALLVANAGTGAIGSLVDVGEPDLRETVEVNLTAVACLLRSALPGMLARGSGGIVTVSSSAVDYPAPQHPVYAATKAAVEHLTRTLRAEAGPHGVVVTCVRPGYVRTPFHDRHGAPVDDVPADRWQTPERVAAAALRAHDRDRAFVDVPRRRLLDRLWPHIAPLRRVLGPVKRRLTG
ncbi:SDR family oxidoreductase [Pseudonocardia sp. KRD291]|uniref:SDR family NAD(P)-dependent oxidoreductase n=1 Tax=Pseudonocardia sp. KRD291 TaxID=2792007 RepID=UPI001C4A3276|nr:SDR family NAD(P)-dependent oxidoreductase [Pseudonocardia sp. KRD291]MBW0101569.1 SDR family NAD(P)-dependent oxidoreductase [Pseudonocardia sp. KRD291]